MQTALLKEVEAASHKNFISVHYVHCMANYTYGIEAGPMVMCSLPIARNR